MNCIISTNLIHRVELGGDRGIIFWACLTDPVQNMFCLRVGIPICPVPLHPYYCRLDLSLGWSFIINVKHGDVSWYIWPGGHGYSFLYRDA